MLKKNNRSEKKSEGYFYERKKSVGLEKCREKVIADPNPAGCQVRESSPCGSMHLLGVK